MLHAIYNLHGEKIWNIFFLFASHYILYQLFIYKFQTGNFPVYNIPDLLYGKLVYSKLPEKYGIALFFIFTSIVCTKVVNG